ncbi:putative alpha-glycosyltransferase/ family 4 [Synechococcus sp. A15-62]|uniref:glycosyltransferase n=1 Tax=Synechococcus sp. A15-62 TaxID=1050657 RepID=UPI0016466C13|nr:glycosyltransferase [Synechococcus sp. A15-62]QNJ00615.1 putative alpha-glycosyltransferase/ family 4 [Synechococcus sp. A15-62]
MKLLRIIRSLDPIGGGPAEGIRQITSHLTALGIDTTVASLDSPDSPWLQGQTFHSKGLGPVLGSYGYRRNLPDCIRAIAQQHDCVIIEGLWQYHAFATWRALRSTGIPYFVYPHGMLDPWFKHAYPLKHLKKWCYWPWADYRVLRDASAVLFTTEQERLLAKQSFSLYRANEEVVGFGTSIPPSEAALQREVFLNHFPHLSDKRLLLFLSRIHPKKGIDLLLDAFSSVASSNSALHLVIAGPDQVGLQGDLTLRANALGIADRITWTGMLSGDLKWGAFRSAELFCLPSYQENFGIVVAESLACGLPVSISDSVNIAPDVASACAGIVHSPTVEGTKAALHHWLQMSYSSRVQMSRNSIDLFDSMFNFASVAGNLVSILKAELN